MKNERRSKRLKLAFLLFVGATFGPLVLGAVSPIFWEEHSEYSEKQRRIGQLIEGQSYLKSFFPITSNLNDRSKLRNNYDCKEQTRQARSMLPNPNAKHSWNPQVVTRLIDAGEIAASSLENMEISKLRYKRLASIPSPMVGALNACINSTILSPICEGYVRQRLSSHRNEAMAKTKNQLKNEIGPMWCVIRDQVSDIIQFDLSKAKVVDYK